MRSREIREVSERARVARELMLAVAAFLFEEATSGVPIIEMEGNQLPFVPAYEIPFIQEWLDVQFSPTFGS
jgi:hypothetical protein